MAKKTAKIFELNSKTNSFVETGTRKGRRDLLMSIDTGKSIKIKSGGLGTLIGEQKNTPSYRVADGNSLKKVFKFAKDNTDPEWMYAKGKDLKTKKTGSFLTTSGKKDEVVLTPLINFGTTHKIKKAVHSHPNDIEGVVYYTEVSSGDKSQVTKLSSDYYNKKSPASFLDTKYYVTRKGSSRMRQYDKNGLIKDQNSRKLYE